MYLYIIIELNHYFCCREHMYVYTSKLISLISLIIVNYHYNNIAQTLIQKRLNTMNRKVSPF